MSGESLSGQVALVTGASRGLGRALAVQLHREGMHVAVTARSADALESLVDELRAHGGPGRVFARAGDVTDPDEVASVVSDVEAALGGVDLLVNNAGVVEPREVPVWEADPREWWDVLSTNLRGPMLFCRCVLPPMLARGRGRVVNINSLRGVRPQATQTAYAVSKGGMALLTASLAAALVGTGVLVFDYSPGRVQTDLARSLVALGSMADRAWTSPDRAIAGVVAIASGRLDALSGRFIHAHDDLAELMSRAEQIARNGGRRLELSEAFPGDPLSERRVAQPR